MSQAKRSSTRNAVPGDVVSVLTAQHRRADVVLVHCQCGQVHRHTGLGQRRAPCGRRYEVVAAARRGFSEAAGQRLIACMLEQVDQAYRDGCDATDRAAYDRGYEDCARERLEAAALALGTAA